MSTLENIEEHNGPTVAEVSTTRPTLPFVQGPVCEPEGVTNTLILDTCNVDTPREDTAEGELEVGGAKTPTSMVGIDTMEDTPTMSSCPSATASFGAVFHQNTDGAWRDPLDQRYERIEPSQPGERERYIPVSIVEDCMKQIDKLVWQLDAGDLEKPFDINDREVHIRTRTGPTARPPQTSSSPNS